MTGLYSSFWLVAIKKLCPNDNLTRPAGEGQEDPRHMDEAEYVLFGCVVTSVCDFAGGRERERCLCFV